MYVVCGCALSTRNRNVHLGSVVFDFLAQPPYVGLYFNKLMQFNARSNSEYAKPIAGNSIRIKITIKIMIYKFLIIIFIIST